jgi:hypothetical protein
MPKWSVYKRDTCEITVQSVLCAAAHERCLLVHRGCILLITADFSVGNFCTFRCNNNNNNNNNNCNTKK